MAWPAQQSRAAGFTWAMCTHTFVHMHSYTHKLKQDSARQLLTGTRVSRAINLQVCVCVREGGVGGLSKK